MHNSCNANVHSLEKLAFSLVYKTSGLTTPTTDFLTEYRRVVCAHACPLQLAITLQPKIYSLNKSFFSSFYQPHSLLSMMRVAFGLLFKPLSRLRRICIKVLQR